MTKRIRIKPAAAEPTLVVETRKLSAFRFAEAGPRPSVLGAHRAIHGAD